MEAYVSHMRTGSTSTSTFDGALRAPRANDQINRQLAQDLLDRFVAAGALKVFVEFSTELEAARGRRPVSEPRGSHARPLPSASRLAQLIPR